MVMLPPGWANGWDAGNHTLRGTEVRHSINSQLRRCWCAPYTVLRACSPYLIPCAATFINLGIPDNKIRVVGNGVDTVKFHPVSRLEARAQFGINVDALVLISVGGLVERKGFHRVIECLPELKTYFPNWCT